MFLNEGNSTFFNDCNNTSCKSVVFYNLKRYTSKYSAGICNNKEGIYVYQLSIICLTCVF